MNILIRKGTSEKVWKRVNSARPERTWLPSNKIISRSRPRSNRTKRKRETFSDAVATAICDLQYAICDIHFHFLNSKVNLRPELQNYFTSKLIFLISSFLQPLNQLLLYFTSVTSYSNITYIESNISSQIEFADTEWSIV